MKTRNYDSDYYGDKYLKLELELDLLVRSILNDKDKHHPQVFLVKLLYKSILIDKNKHYPQGYLVECFYKLAK